MTGWWIATGCLMLAVLALTPTYRRRRHRRRRLDQVRARVEASLSEHLKQPDSSPEGGEGEPPTALPATPPRTAVWCRRRVMLGDLAPSITSAPRWRMR